MKNLPQKLRFLITGHTVVTTSCQGWAGRANGALVEAAEGAGFEVLLTSDQNLSYQQDMRRRRIALVVLSTNRWELLLVNVNEVIAAVDAAGPGTYRFVEIGH
jgi:hypothetical protein